MLYPSRDLGPLPVDAINLARGTEMLPGRASLSSQAHKHIAIDHPADYAICLAHLAATIASPTFVGQAPGHTRNFEMVRRIGLADGRLVLVAIGIERDRSGTYAVRSCYLIKPETVQQRRQNHRLKLVVWR